MKQNPSLHGEAFNFGPKISQNKSVLELVTQSKKSWKNIKWKIVKTKKPKYESKLLKLNSNKAKLRLKWKPVLSFSETIQMVINWYKFYYFNKKNLLDYSKNQLINYMKKVKGI